MAVLFLLGFSSGLPLMLTGQTLQAWFTAEHVSLERIGARARGPPEGQRSPRATVHEIQTWLQVVVEDPCDLDVPRAMYLKVDDVYRSLHALLTSSMPDMEAADFRWDPSVGTRQRAFRSFRDGTHRRCEERGVAAPSCFPPAIQALFEDCFEIGPRCVGEMKTSHA